MFLLSWNVAGWSSTAQAIRENFGTLESFFAQTKADVICIQEAKGSWAKIDRNPIDAGVADSGHSGISGWESFWAFSGKGYRGFNGVGVFARSGLVHKCDPTPFGKKDLDEEGRVVVLYFSSMIVVNVYVVNGRNGTREVFKQHFLSQLRQLFQFLRSSTGLPVVLLGDLNMTYRAKDVHWTFRRIEVVMCLNMLKELGSCTDSTAWVKAYPCLALATFCYLMRDVILQLCNDLFVVTDEKSSRPAPDQVSKSIAVDVTGCVAGNDVFVPGKKEDEAVVEAARLALRKQIEARGIGEIRQSLDVLSRRAAVDQVGVSEFSSSASEWISKFIDAGLLCVFSADLVKTNSAIFNRGVYILGKYCGSAPHSQASREFLGTQLLGSTHDGHEGMHDVFLIGGDDGPPCQRSPSYYWPPCPYSCWDQSRNKRSTNEGSRIDYVLVDDALKSFVVPCMKTRNNALPEKIRDPSLDTSCEEEVEPLFQELGELQRSIVRTTAEGAYPPAALDGSGLPPLSNAASLIQFHGLPSTGLFLTPPQYSDHCGIAVLFRDGISLKPREKGVKVQESVRCQYKPPTNLHFFFLKKVEQTPCSLDSEDTADAVTTRKRNRATDDSEVDRTRGSSVPEAPISTGGAASNIVTIIE